MNTSNSKYRGTFVHRYANQCKWEKSYNCNNCWKWHRKRPFIQQIIFSKFIMILHINLGSFADWVSVLFSDFSFLILRHLFTIKLTYMIAFIIVFFSSSIFHIYFGKFQNAFAIEVNRCCRIMHSFVFGRMIEPFLSSLEIFVHVSATHTHTHTFITKYFDITTQLS